MHFWKKSHLSVLALGRSQRHFSDKVTWWRFQSTSKEVIWPNFFNYMQVPSWKIFRKGWDGRVLLVRPSKMHHSIWKNYFCFGCRWISRKRLFFYVKIFQNNNVPKIWQHQIMSNKDIKLHWLLKKGVRLNSSPYLTWFEPFRMKKIWKKSKMWPRLS